MAAKKIQHLGPRERERVAPLFVGGGEDGVDPEAGDVARRGQAGVGEEFQRAARQDVRGEIRH